MFIDMHMHEMTCSKDSFLKLDQIVSIAREKGLGAVPVMVPDLVEPTEEIRGLAYAVCDSLTEVKGLLELL